MTFFEELNEFIIKQINGKISQKQKERLHDINDYANFRSNIEENLILGTNWHLVFERLIIEPPTVKDAEFIKTLSDDSLMRNIVVLNHALSECIDSFEEGKPKTQILHAYYRMLKNEVANRPSMNYYMAKGDGYQEYLEDRTDRLATSKELESARVSGSVCIFCGSKDVGSYNSEKWKCRDCKRQFRKRLS